MPPTGIHTRHGRYGTLAQFILIDVDTFFVGWDGWHGFGPYLVGSRIMGGSMVMMGLFVLRFILLERIGSWSSLSIAMLVMMVAGGPR